MKIRSLGYLVILIGLLIGCRAIKPSGIKSGKNLYETFYIGNGGTQYFIKPLYYQGQNSTLTIDYTFRYPDTTSNDVVINFSIISDSVLRNVQELKVGNTIVQDIKPLYNETSNKQFLSRFTGWAPLKSLKNYVTQHNHSVTIKQNKSKITFTPSSKTEKTLQKLSQNLFVLIE